MAITVRAEFTSRPARRDDFVKLAAALTKAAADEPGTLRYDWFLGAGPDDFVVIEEYLDSEAAFAHNAHCADLLNTVPDLAEMTAVQLHGELSPKLETWIASNPTAQAYPPLA